MNETALEVFDENQDVIFTDNGKWIHPLFNLKEFIEENKLDPKKLSLNDKIIGLGAAVVISKIGVSACHGMLVSKLAVAFLKKHKIEIIWAELVDCIACKTEGLLNIDMSIEEAYEILEKRRKNSSVR
jgi:hypothetical protein